VSTTHGDEHLETILALAFVAEFRDADTSHHLRRISLLSRTLAASAGLDEAAVALLGLAAPMHDVGQVAIPDDILLKPGALTPDERRTMQDHTVIGARLLARGDTAVLRAGCQIARSHHERWDGRGYPDGLVGDETPLPARIAGLADVFDALVTKRIYRDALSVEAALAIIRQGAGSQFDPALVDAFFGVQDEIVAICSGFSDEDEEEQWVA